LGADVMRRSSWARS